MSMVLMEHELYTQVPNATYKRGDIWIADLDDLYAGSEQGGKRPVLIIQNDIGNRYSPTVIVAVLTTKKQTKELPTHVKLSAFQNGLKEDSIVLCEQLQTIDKLLLMERKTQLSNEVMGRIDQAIDISVGRY